MSKHNEHTKHEKTEYEAPPCWEESSPPPAPEGGLESGAEAAAPPELAALLLYLKVGYDSFEPIEGAYFSRLRELLAFHNIVDPQAPLDRTNYQAAVRQFQNAAGQGLTADGIPGENTLWALQQDWAIARNLQLVKVTADVWPHRDGYNNFMVRADVVAHYNQLRAAAQALGGVVTSSGSLRDLNAAVSAGRSPTSLHYTGVALDMSINTGMRDSAGDPFIISHDGTDWRIWGRGGGTAHSVSAVLWSNGATQQVQVSDDLFDFTALAQQHGFRTIPARSCFPHDYICAEWWHMQCEAVLVPYISQFGAELLSLAPYSLQQVQHQTPIWNNRKRIFKRMTNGWW